MVPAFGAHAILAILAAFLLRGGRAAAVAACILVGNPLTHALIVPVTYEIGRLVLPRPPMPHQAWLPGWLGAAFPVAEETLLGGALLGLAAAGPAYIVMVGLLRRQARRLEGTPPAQD